MTLIADRGAVHCQREDLLIPQVPEATKSFQPIPHYDLATSIRNISTDLLSRDYVLLAEDYVLARQGAQLFALLSFQGENKDTALSIGYRSSYDSSLALKLATGASVLVCSNLSLSGDNIAVMRKHSKGIMDGLDDMIISAVYKASHSHRQIIADHNALKQIEMTDNQAAHLLGSLYWNGIISPRQVPVVREEWLRPKHEEFMPRTAYSFYNSVSEALKENTPISHTIERHIQLHKVMVEGRAIWAS